MKLNININDQLELSLNQSPGLPVSSLATRHSPLATSRWWFARMRHIVNRAIDWRPAPLGRPEQIWFPNHQHHLAE